MDITLMIIINFISSESINRVGSLAYFTHSDSIIRKYLRFIVKH